MEHESIFRLEERLKEAETNLLRVQKWQRDEGNATDNGTWSNWVRAENSWQYIVYELRIRIEQEMNALITEFGQLLDEEAS